MPEFTTNQLVVLALVLILGWFLGLYTLAGGRQWRKAFEGERVARMAADAENDRLRVKLTELEGERESRIALEAERDGHLARATASNSRIAELEKDRPFINTDTAGSIAAAASGKRDDLSRIFGIGRSGEIKLNELGVYSYATLIALSPSDEAALEGRMGLAPASIADERWREQAEMLHSGKFDDHARLFA